MKYHKYHKKILTLAAVVCSSCLALGSIGVYNANATTNTPFSISYDEADFQSSFGSTYVDDTDKSGLLLRSKKSGTSAEDISFTFDDTFTNAFEMDFRVTSEKTYAYPAWGSGATHYIGDESTGLSPADMFSDDMNPYLDLKEVSFKFTSMSDPDKYFVVYVRGASGYMASMCSSYVYIPGDQTNAMKDETGEYVQGYGYNYSWTKNGTAWIQGAPHYDAQGTGNTRSDYSLSNDGITAILGTSFSNFLTTSVSNKTQAQTTSNLIRFDPQTMNVYMNVGKSNGSNYSAINTSADMLVRDLAENKYFTAKNGGSVASLSPDDFAKGYSVEVSFTDVTDNACAGNSALFESPYLYSAPASAYTRTPQMTVYRVNDTEFTQNNVAINEVNRSVSRAQSDFIRYDSTQLSVNENVGSRDYGERGLLLKSTQSGTDAIGTKFDFKDTMYGDFSTSFRVTSQNRYPNLPRKSYGTHWVTNDAVLGTQMLYSDQQNPYIDLREVAFTFTSNSDPTKRFTVYIMGTYSGIAYATSARVYVDGDNIGQKDPEGVMRYGYGLPDDGSKYSNALTVTVLRGTSFCNFNAQNSGSRLDTFANAIRFSPEDMCVYATGAMKNDSTSSIPKEKLVRNLLDNSQVLDEYKYTFGKLDKNDFAKGYTVSVSFTDVTDNAFTGGLSANANGFSGVVASGNIKASSYTHIQEAYDRYPEMVLYSLNGQSLEYNNETEKTILDKNAPVLSPTVFTTNINEIIDLTPNFYDAATGDDQPATEGSVSVSTDGVSFTTLQKQDGAYLYTVDAYKLYVKYVGYKDQAGNIANTVTEVFIKDEISPELALKENVATTYDFTSGNRPTISLSDVFIANRNDEVKTYEIVIESITRANGAPVSPTVTHLNFLEAGEYKIVYKATDSFGNVSTLTRTITAGDFSAPTFTIADGFDCKLGESVDLSALTFSDYDHNASLTVSVFDGETEIYQGTKFTPKQAGEYTVVYTASDSSGNVATQATSLKVSAGEAIVLEEPQRSNVDLISICLLIVSGLVAAIGIASIIIYKKEKKQ